MERGELGVPAQGPHVVFVFEGLVANLKQKRVEKIALRQHWWEAALDCWDLDYRTLDYINAYMTRFKSTVQVITWRPPGFASQVHDRLWAMDCPVDRTRSGNYRSLSQRFATDSDIGIVYDPDPAHRFGYGYKAREFDIARF